MKWGIYWVSPDGKSGEDVVKADDANEARKEWRSLHDEPSHQIISVYDVPEETEEFVCF